MKIFKQRGRDTGGREFLLELQEGYRQLHEKHDKLKERVREIEGKLDLLLNRLDLKVVKQADHPLIEIVEKEGKEK